MNKHNNPNYNCKTPVVECSTPHPEKEPGCDGKCAPDECVCVTEKEEKCDILKCMSTHTGECKLSCSPSCPHTEKTRCNKKSCDGISFPHEYHCAKCGEGMEEKCSECHTLSLLSDNPVFKCPRHKHLAPSQAKQEDDMEKYMRIRATHDPKLRKLLEDEAEERQFLEDVYKGTIFGKDEDNCCPHPKTDWEEEEREKYESLFGIKSFTGKDWNKQVVEYWIKRIRSLLSSAHQEGYDKGLNNAPYEYYQQIRKDILQAGREEERERIRKIILTATEIPKGARNPTRDATVILGEKLIDLISSSLDTKVKP